VALWVARVIGTELVVLLAVLEATLLRRTERVLSARWGKAFLRWVLLVAALLLLVLLTLIIALLGRIALLLAISLLRILRAVALTALATVGVVRTGHYE